MIVAAAYLRKSNEQNVSEDQKSVVLQRKLAHEYAARKGWSLDERYIFEDDAISGAEFKKRPGLDALMAAVSTEPRPPFDVLIVEEQSRLGRDLVRTLYMIQTINDAGVRIFARLSDHEVTVSGDDKLRAIIGGISDEDVVTKTSARVATKMREKVRDGLVAGGKVFGYRNSRVSKGRTERVIYEPEAAVVRRIFERTRDGHGLAKIRAALNKEGVPGPQYACPPLRENPTHEHGDECPRGEWSPTSVREILHRDLYRGVIIYGQMKRGRSKGTKTRSRVTDESQILRREAPELRIIDGVLWDAAHAQIAQKAGAWLRRDGKLHGQVESLRGKYLLSGFLVCGMCGAPLIAQQRGRNLRLVYVCKARKERGETVCHNSSGVPLDRLHAATIESLRDTFSPEHFEMYLAQKASDEQARASRAAEREALIARIPVLNAEAERLANAIATGSGTLDVLLSAIKERQAEREAAELRLAQIEGEERDLRAESDAVERLRAVWKDWSGALDVDDPVLTRQLLRKLLARPLRVGPMGRGGWEFRGEGRYDGILLGGVYNRHPEWTGGTSARPMKNQGSVWPWPAPIAGGSDAATGGAIVRVTSGPPIYLLSARAPPAAYHAETPPRT